MLISQWISLCVFGMAFIMSMQGFSLLGLQMLMWWLFQITAIATVVSCRYAPKYYYDRVLKEKIASFADSGKMVRSQYRVNTLERLVEKNGGEPVRKNDVNLTLAYNVIGIRGTVEKISYQSTEILTVNDSVISFTDSTLFNKNFQNLTKNSPYEFVSIIVSISYGEDISKVRAILEETLEGYRKKKDRYGRLLIWLKGCLTRELTNLFGKMSKFA